jgi:hypothetical protein
MRRLAATAVVVAIAIVQGCATQNRTDPATPPAAGRGRPIAEGVIFSARFKNADNASGSEGFTRLNEPRAVPGNNGSWNVDAYGKLYPDYLIITYPQQPELGPKVIPAARIIEIQFGDGGIKQVGASKTYR